ncbi:MAG: sulfatase-like hydrolase/transferase [Deltaproteobacteria bacterium]|nr:sulfatase-like hydrolase/transferase [Deltaproteobacteria bacterium]
MIVFVALFVLMLVANATFEVMGQSDDSVSEIVIEQYLGDVVGNLLAILAAYIAIGAMIGVGVLLVLTGLAGRRLGKMSRFAALPCVIMVHAVIWAWHIKQFPQVHNALLYKRSGSLAALQRFITHDLSPVVFTVVGFFALAVILAAIVRTAITQRGSISQSLGPRQQRVVAAVVCSTTFLAIALMVFIASRINGGTRSRPNILVVANDSMRMESLGFGGYGRDTSPNMDTFVKDSVIFDQAYVPLARTFPSWATFLTGQLPYRHGIRHMFPMPKRRLQGQVALPRFLNQQGYRTAIVADYAGDVFTRMDVGFEKVDAPPFTFRSLIAQRCLLMHPAVLPYLGNRLGRFLFPNLAGLSELSQTDTTVDAFLDTIDGGDGRPFFIVGFFSASHFPFASPYPYYKMFADPGYTGSSLYMRFQEMHEKAGAITKEAEQIRALFDGTIRHFDHHFGDIVRHLEKRGLLDNTIVVLTADHGEQVAEFGTLGHGGHLRGRHAYRIPFVFHAPWLEPRRIDALVRSQDFARTICGLLGLDPPDGIGGVDLGPLLRGDKESLGLLGFGETGMWLVEKGAEFYFENRIPYPGLIHAAEVRSDFDDEVCIQPKYEDIVVRAKHRAVWDEERKVIYVPTPDGPVIEAYRLENGLEVPDDTPDPRLLEELLKTLELDGQSEFIRDLLPGRYSSPLDAATR